MAVERLSVCVGRADCVEAAGRNRCAGSIACGAYAEKSSSALPVFRRPARRGVLRADRLVAWFVGGGAGGWWIYYYRL